MIVIMTMIMIIMSVARYVYWQLSEKVKLNEQICGRK